MVTMGTQKLWTCWQRHIALKRWIATERTIIFLFFTLGSTWSRGISKIKSITKKTTKLAGMMWHLINKAVMKKNCVEALNQHAQLLEKKAAFTRFTWNIGNPSTMTTEKRNSWTINQAECFHRNWLKCVIIMWSYYQYYYYYYGKPLVQWPEDRLRCDV